MINFALIDPNVRGSVIKSRAIVQVKAGTVTTDAVGALYGIVQANPDFTAGILICFENQRATVDNWIRRHNPPPIRDNTIRGQRTGWPVVQCLTIEDMLQSDSWMHFLPIQSPRSLIEERAAPESGQMPLA